MKSELDFFLDEFKYIDINSFIGTLALDKNEEQHIGRLTQFIADKIDNIILTKDDHLLEKFTNIILDNELNQSPTESTSEKITHLVAKAAYNYFYDNKAFKDLVSEYINSDSEDNCEPNNGCIDEISEYLKGFTNKLTDHLRKFDKKKLTIKVIDGSCTINNYNSEDIIKNQYISKELDILFETKQKLPVGQEDILMNQIIGFFKKNKDDLEYIENYATNDFAFKIHLLNLRDMDKAGVDINTKKSPLPDLPGGRGPNTHSLFRPSIQTTTLSL